VSNAEPVANVYEDVATYVPSDPSFTLLSVIQSGMDDVGDDVVDSMEATFMLSGRTGTFSIETPLVYENVPDPVAQGNLIYEYILQEVAVVNALYGLA
jgi:hypothetical protein